MAASERASNPSPLLVQKRANFARLGRAGQWVGIEPDVIPEEELATKGRVLSFGSDQ